MYILLEIGKSYPKRKTRTSNLFYIKTSKKKYSLFRLRGTFMWRTENYITKIANKYYLQFSLKNPWFVPKKGYVGKNNIKLYGWLFLYVGRTKELII